MAEKMEFPNTLDEFIRQYSFIDEEQIYTNGIELISVFRIRQWEEHKKEENQELRKLFEIGKEQYNDLVEEKEELQEQLSSNTLQFENQQKEFIECLEKEIKETDKTIEMLCDTNSCRIPYLQNKNRLLKEILKKYEETIGGSNANISRR